MNIQTKSSEKNLKNMAFLILPVILPGNIMSYTLIYDILLKVRILGFTMSLISYQSKIVSKYMVTKSYFIYCLSLNPKGRAYRNNNSRNNKIKDI